MKIQAAIAHGGTEPLTIEELDLDDPRENDVLVRVTASGVCHTDLSMLKFGMLPWPAVLGHEGAGIVERVGPGVTGLKAGDHVVMTSLSCGECVACKQGNPSYCRNFIAMNMGGGYRADGSCSHCRNGKPVFGRFFCQSSFANYVLASERNTIKVPSDLPLEVIAPLGCGIQTGAGAVLNTLRAPTGSTIAVFGAGAVGLAAVMAAKVTGCSTIIAVDLVPSRLELAMEVGATHVINAAECDAPTRVKEVAAGGVDFALEATGVATVMEQAIRSLGYGGVACIAGAVAPGTTISVSPSDLQQHGQIVKGTMMAGQGVRAQDFVLKLIELWRAGQMPFDRLIKFYDFSEINQAFADAQNGSALKPVLRMA